MTTKIPRLAALALGCLLFSAITLSAATMLTPWSADAQAGKAWQEYPRPQMVRDTWQNLNGQWDYAITPIAASAPQKYDGQIRVPYCVESALSGVTKSFKPDQRLWYHRTFTLPKTWDGQRVLLHFGAVDWETTVTVNGAPAGSHRGGFTPFTLDITDCLKAGGDQDIVIAVTDPTSEGEQPRGKQRLDPSGIWYTPVSGIWQTVWLEPVPAEMSIASIKCTPDLDKSALTLTTMGSRTALGDTFYAIRARVLDGGKVVAEASGRLNRALTINIPNPKTWSPDSPFLYDLQVDLCQVPNPFAAPDAGAKGKKGKGSGKAGIPPFFGDKEQAYFAKIPSDAKQLDSVKGYFAMRKVSLGQGPKGVVMMLNNKPLFHLGPLDQGYWPDGLLTPPSEAGMRFDLDFLKKAGFNMLRKHIKVEPALYYAYCDKIGLLVWQDMPSGWTERERRVPGADTQHVQPDSQGELKKRPEVAAQFESELRDMMDALYNFPSIVVWVPFNEGWGQYDTIRVADWVKNYDPSRLVNEVSGWRHAGGGDILDYHNYAVNMPADKLVRNDTKRALVLGEFGGLTLRVEGHMWQTDKRGQTYNAANVPQSADELIKQYIQRMTQVRDMAKANGMCAGVYTQTTDVEGELNGLITYDRKVIKVPAEKLAEIHKSLGLY